MLQYEVYSCCYFLLDISLEDIVFGIVKLLISKVPEGRCDNKDADRENFTFSLVPDMAMLYMLRLNALWHKQLCFIGV